MSFNPKYASTKAHTRARKGDWIVPSPLHQSVQNEQMGPCHFLRLPGEIRSQIYAYVFEDPQVFYMKSLAKNKGLTHYQALKPRKGKLGVTLSTEATEKRRRRFDLARRLHSTEPPSEYETATGPAALLQVNRLFHRETWHTFYARNTFIFTSHKVLQRFLSALNPSYKGAIRRVMLQYQTYGEPYCTADQQWKDDDDSSWLQACTRAAQEMCGIEELHIKLRINDGPLRLNLEAKWAEPLLAFRGRNLQRVYTLLSARSVHNDPSCKACAKLVSKELLGAEHKRSGEIEAKKVVVPKALKCLRIV
ncbi:MAG: hypothetical protein LQ347_006891 [Umbilicaria vellea]|nr:MAG: hypothetical protein LQ347_006891 [Umbilicaria vellea]